MAALEAAASEAAAVVVAAAWRWRWQLGGSVEGTAVGAAACVGEAESRRISISCPNFWMSGKKSIGMPKFCVVDA